MNQKCTGASACRRIVLQCRCDTWYRAILPQSLGFKSHSAGQGSAFWNLSLEIYANSHITQEACQGEEKHINYTSVAEQGLFGNPFLPSNPPKKDSVGHSVAFPRMDANRLLLGALKGGGQSYGLKTYMCFFCPLIALPLATRTSPTRKVSSLICFLTIYRC